MSGTCPLPKRRDPLELELIAAHPVTRYTAAQACAYIEARSSGASSPQANTSDATFARARARANARKWTAHRNRIEGTRTAREEFARALITVNGQ